MKGQNLDGLIDTVANLIITAKRVIVFTGAGVSTESGIPDFRSPGGIWDRFDPDDFTYHKFIKDPEVRRRQWQMPLPREVLAQATFRSHHCDLFIVIGSTLVVYPAAYMPEHAFDSGAKLVIINLSPTPMDKQATVLIRAKAGEAMPRIIKRVREKSVAT